jgi:hypothetical protein
MQKGVVFITNYLRRYRPGQTRERQRLKSPGSKQQTKTSGYRIGGRTFLFQEASLFFYFTEGE